MSDPASIGHCPGRTLLLVGGGAVGGLALLLLAHREGIGRIILSGRDEVLGRFKLNLAALGAAGQGLPTTFAFVQNDVEDVDATARLLDRVKPDVVLLAVATHPPSYLGTLDLPEGIRAQWRAAGFGAQLPWHLRLPARFTRALVKSGIQTHLINASFPDVVNPALWNHFGRGPTVGVGNIDNLASRVLRRVSEEEQVPVGDLRLCLIGSHALAVQGPAAGVPFFMSITLGDGDLTGRYDAEELLRPPLAHEGALARRPDLWPYVNHSAATSAVKTILAILNDQDQYTHAAGPNGLIGGYPVRLNARGAQLMLPPRLALEEAIRINQDAERFDGIERIESDGTLVFTDRTYQAMKALGYDCQELTFDALDCRAKELDGVIAKLRALWHLHRLRG